ncbi:MAG TPA: DivIVA domain-containing protein [Catenuloplanes sp.]
MAAARIRNVDFPKARRGGYDEAAVRTFLDGVAQDVEELHTALVIAHQETERYKNALLGGWRSEQAGPSSDIKAEAATPAPPPTHAEHRTPHTIESRYQPAHAHYGSSPHAPVVQAPMAFDRP